jgi:hypothetical protein
VFIFRHPPARLAAIATVTVGCPLTAAVLATLSPAADPRPLAAVACIAAGVVAAIVIHLAWPAAAPDLGEDGAPVTLHGSLRAVQRQVSTQGRPWCTAVLDTPAWLVPLDVYPVPYAGAGRLTVDQAVTVTGRIDRRAAGPARVSVSVVAPGTCNSERAV